MKRDRQSPIPKRLPDAVNASPPSNYTQISNDMLRDNRISFKAKGILSCLLSNRKGWTSYLEGLKKLTNEGEASIRSGMKELTKAGYLIYLVYRDKKNSHVCGSFMSYTTIPFKFNLMDHYLWAEENDMKIGFHPRQTEAESLFSENINIGKVSLGNLVLGNKSLIILNNKNTNFKEDYSLAKAGAEEDRKGSLPIPTQGSGGKLPSLNLPMQSSTNGFITPSQFDDFWRAYPNHKGGKAKAKVAWDKACLKKDRPTWKALRVAISAQLKSDQWSDPQFIPHATTWLNQSRWLDDPKDLVSYKRTAPKNGLCCSEEESKLYRRVDQVIHVG